MINCALKRGPILDQNPREISANPSLRCGQNFPLPIWENIVSFNCINAQILVYMERTEKGSFSLSNFGNERKREGFDASYFLNPRRALYKRVGCSGLCNERNTHEYRKRIGVF